MANNLSQIPLALEDCEFFLDKQVTYYLFINVVAFIFLSSPNDNNKYGFTPNLMLVILLNIPRK